jgi:membrane associated rhomboid family serine protease
MAFVVLPIGTDAPLQSKPTVNYVLIALNIGIFGLFNILGKMPGGAELLQIHQHMILYPATPDLYQFVTYQFLHAGWAHILGNMWFLWLFGNAVNSKMGNVPYLFFYLAGGVFAGIGFSLTEMQNPVLGASGAIAAVTTAYLVLFPRSTVRLFYWFFVFIGDIQVGSILLIVGKMIVWDNIITADLLPGTGAERQIAYEAHLSGYAFGFVAALLMLLVKALPRDPFDIVSLWNRWKRRREFAGIYGPGAPAIAQTPVARPVQQSQDWLSEETVPPISDDPHDGRKNLRTRIAREIDKFDLAAATKTYRELIQLDPKQVLVRSNQLDVANQLTAEGDYPLATEAYEKFLNRYPNGATVQHVRFLLGVIYARHLRNYPKAIECLETCHRDLTNANMVKQCDYWLAVAREQGGNGGEGDAETR